MVIDDPIAGTEEAVECPVRARAQEALDAADATLSAPRPFAAALHEAQERAEREREEEQRWQRRAAPRAPAPTPAPPPAPSADDEAPVPMGVFVKVIQNLIEEERERAAREQQPLLERMARLEARLAQSEGRLAAVESRKSKK